MHLLILLFVTEPVIFRTAFDQNDFRLNLSPQKILALGFVGGPETKFFWLNHTRIVIRSSRSIQAESWKEHVPFLN